MTAFASVTPIAAAPDQLPRPILTPLAALLGDLQTDANRRRDSLVNGVPLGPGTGLKSLDRILGGALEPGLHILHASPGAGKTALALQIAASCQCPALFVTCEMTPLELLRRHTARITGTYLGKMKDGSLTGDTVVDLARRAAAAAPLLSLLDATQAPAPPLEVAAAVAQVRGVEPAEHFLLVVDSLQSWADGVGGGESEYDRLNAALVALRMLSKRLACPVLVISERNRQAMSAGGQSAGAGTRKIEYGAETVIELDTDEKDARPDVRTGKIRVLVKFSKNRNGTMGTALPLDFEGRCQRFTESDT